MISPPTDEPRFSDLERRADGLLFALFLGVWIAILVLFLFPGGTARNWAVLVGGLIAGAAVGMPLGRALGQGYVGGMFLYRWLRIGIMVFTVGGVLTAMVLATVAFGPATQVTP
jgi:hypothetical protein